jgi:hypothetical protein
MREHEDPHAGSTPPLDQTGSLNGQTERSMRRDVIFRIGLIASEQITRRHLPAVRSGIGLKPRCDLLLRSWCSGSNVQGSDQVPTRRAMKLTHVPDYMSHAPKVLPLTSSGSKSELGQNATSALTWVNILHSGGSSEFGNPATSGGSGASPFDAHARAHTHTYEALPEVLPLPPLREAP